MHPATLRSFDVNSWLVEHDPLPVRMWHDPQVEACGYDARSAYVETYWLGVLGPSCILAARRLVCWLEVEPDGFDISLAAFARTLGLGTGIGRHSPVVRTLRRLVDFGIARVDDDTYTIGRAFPRLSARQIQRLPDHLAAAHATEPAIEAVGR